MSNYKPQPGDIVCNLRWPTKTDMEIHVYQVTDERVNYGWWKDGKGCGNGSKLLARFIEMAEEATVRVGAFDPNNTSTEVIEWGK